MVILPHGDDAARCLTRQKGLLHELEDLFRSSGRDRIVLAGDFNMHPQNIPGAMPHYGLVDLIEATASQRGRLEGCSGCSLGDDCCHMWTHKKPGGPNASVQQLDFMFATAPLADRVGKVWGGVADFPDVWDVSDHAPVVAEFE